MKLLILLTSVFFTLNSFAQVPLYRFNKNQIEFSLVNNSTGIIIECTHELLSHVPWWKVVCDTRTYTVDTWIQTQKHGKLHKSTLMFHASEGLRSSGKKLVQFKSHLTSFITEGESQLIGITSSLDIRNAQADLVLRTK